MIVVSEKSNDIRKDRGLHLSVYCLCRNDRYVGRDSSRLRSTPRVQGRPTSSHCTPGATHLPFRRDHHYPASRNSFGGDGQAVEPDYPSVRLPTRGIRG